MKKTNSKQAYDKMAEKYVIKSETSLHNKFYERPAMLSMLDNVEKKMVFDAGCGGGTMLEWLVKNGANIVACDISDSLVNYAKNRLPDEAENIFLANLEEPLEFIRSKKIDIIISSLVLHYIEDWCPALKEFNRILKGDGYIIISTHHPHADWKWAEMDNYFEKKVNEEIWKVGDDFEQEVKFFHRTLMEIFEDLNKSGFYVEKLLEPYPVEEGRKLNPKSFEYLCKNPHFLFLRIRKILDL